MNSSEKFLSPMVTGGLPTPGPLAAAAGLAPVAVEDVGAAALLVGLELEDDLPQAASSAAVSVASATASARFGCLRVLDSSWVVVVGPYAGSVTMGTSAAT